MGNLLSYLRHEVIANFVLKSLQKIFKKVTVDFSSNVGLGVLCKCHQIDVNEGNMVSVTGG